MDYGCGIKIEHAIIFLTLLNISGCIAIREPASAGRAKLFEVAGLGQSYQLTTTISLNEPGERKGKEVGYQVRGDVSIAVKWQRNQEKLLEIQLVEPKLFIQSTKKETTPHVFDVHKSNLDDAKGYPIYAHWNNGKIHSVYVDEREGTSLANIKKGIASLLQFQVVDGETEETDSSGRCRVSYRSIDPLSFSKTKTECRDGVGDKSRKRDNPEPILNVDVTAEVTATYKLSQDLSGLESVTSFEHREVTMAIKREVGGSVTATQHLSLNGKTFKVDVLDSPNVEGAVAKLSSAAKLKLTKRDLRLETEVQDCDKDCPSLPKLLKENRGHLSDSNLGSFKSAGAFVKLLSAARSSPETDLVKAFKGTKNKEILAQLCDLAGAIQTRKSHELIMKLINFDSENDFDHCERYLWSLASGSRPDEFIIRDIFNNAQKTHPNEKLDETLVLSLASMTHRFDKVPGHGNSSLVKEIVDYLTGELEMCKVENCKILYLRALKNLRHPETIPLVMKHAAHGKSKTRIEALKCLKSFEPRHWTTTVLDLAQRIYFKVGKRYDSSSRTLALDILLESGPSREMLQDLLLTLTEREAEYEVQRYLVQRIGQISERDDNFARLVTSIKKDFSDLFNNYNVAAQRGLSTAFARNFVTDKHRNGSLSTVLEISKGLLKRGIVDVAVGNSQKTTSLFTLGLFAGGLSSFVSSSDSQEDNGKPDEDDDEDDLTTAGMELTVLGSQVRPFTFFSGQGELMGHVWSGTASEKTPAYQAIILVIDYLDHIPLQNGFMAIVEVLGAVSFDLSGQIQISLWNKNAHSLVEKNAGISLQGNLRVDSSFVKSKVDFNVATEVKLNLQSDLNFYGGNHLCMQLSQPEVVMKHNVHKIERIPGGKHRLRKSRYTQFKVPGRTYVLNKKNSDMCNEIFS